jgi:RHS repeat-associated protein
MYWDFAGPAVIADTSSLTTRRPWYSMVYNDAVQGLALSPYGMTDASRYQVQHLAGQKQYELSNHLGNVQATVSDLPVKVGEAHTEYHAPALPAVYDYYPFGMLMPDRYTSDTSSECVTVSQTKWVTTWVTHCYLAADWVWPAYSYYGTVSVSTSSGLQIAASESSGVYFEMDVLPYEQQDVYLQTDAFYSGSGTLELQEYHGGQWMTLGSATFDKIGEVRISIRPREDRIRAVLRGPFYVQVKQFCVQRPQLSQETVLVDICDTDGDKYRFGYQKMEKLNEWSGIGNTLDFGARIYDSRIARFLSIDPLIAKYPDLSPYAFAANNPIMYVDRDGEEPTLAAYKTAAEKLGVSIAQIRAVYKTEVGAKHLLPDGRIKILYEPHRFKDYTKGKYDASHPHLSKSYSSMYKYGSEKRQYDLYKEAVELDPENAAKSISLGGFQILGSNYKAAGYSSATQFADKMMNGTEDDHLEAFTNFIINDKTINKKAGQTMTKHDALKANNWQQFALGYNGSSYKDYNYDSKMSDNYDGFKDDPTKGLENEGSSGSSSSLPQKPPPIDSSFEGLK